MWFFTKRIKFNMANLTKFENHRSGWDYAMGQLRDLHDDHGVIFDDFLERRSAGTG